MPCEGLSSSSTSLKIEVLVLLTVIGLHTFGFALPKWSTTRLTMYTRSVGDMKFYLHFGLWSDCACLTMQGNEECRCDSKTIETGYTQFVSGVETVALIGLVISGIMTVVLLFYKGAKQLKVINIVIVILSGIAIIVGVVVYAGNCLDDYDHIKSAGTTVDLPGTIWYPTSPTTSFYLCAVAGALCLIGCTSLLVIDYHSATRGEHNTPMRNLGQGQILPPSELQYYPTQIGYVPTNNVRDLLGYISTSSASRQHEAPRVQNNIPMKSQCQDQIIYPPAVQYPSHVPPQDAR